MITKLGSDALDNAIDAGAAIGGLGLLNSGLRSPSLTGRQNFYHVTTADRAKQIYREGLKPALKFEDTNFARNLRNYPDDRAARSLGKTFVTTDPLAAKDYLSSLKNGVVIRGNADLRDFKTVTNPEVDMPFEQWEKSLTPDDRKAFPDEKSRRQVYNDLRKSTVIDGAIGPEHIKGSSKYKGPGFKDVLRQINRSPLRFAGAAGRALGGAAMIGWSLYDLYKRYFGDEDKK